MSNIFKDKIFKNKAFIPFLTAGDPNADTTAQLEEQGYTEFKDYYREELKH